MSDLKERIVELWYRILGDPKGRIALIAGLLLVGGVVLGSGVYKLLRGPEVSVPRDHQVQESARALRAAEAAVEEQNKIREKAIADTQAYPGYAAQRLSVQPQHPGAVTGNVRPTGAVVRR